MNVASTSEWPKCYNLKFMNDQKSLNLSMMINNEVILLIPNSQDKTFALSSNKKPALASFVCGRNYHLNYACP